MNVVVFGEDCFTGIVIDSLIRSGHNVQVIIMPYYNDYLYLTLEHVARKNKIPFFRSGDINSGETINILKSLNPELLISVHLRKILKREVFMIPVLGSINVHPSLLPRYRGMSPQFQAIRNGDKETGVTVHFIDDFVDTGNIIIQDYFPVLEDDYILDVQFKVMEVYKTIVVKAIELIKDGIFTGYTQNPLQASYFGPVRRDDREISLNKTAREVYNLIRAVSIPFRGAFYNEYTIWSSQIPDYNRYEKLKQVYSSPGVYRCNNELIIRTSDGILVSENFRISQ